LPQISVIMPVSESRVHNLMGTLRSLTHQTLPASEFEVCLGVDGVSIDPIQHVIDIISPEFEVKCEALGDVKESVRRNAARNLACSLCTSPLMMINDADMLLPPGALSEILAAHRSALADGRHAAIFQRLARIENSLSEWHKISADYMENKLSLGGLLTRATLSNRIFSSFSEINIEKLRECRAIKVRSVQENFPTIETWMWRDLGGFDERFIGWGGNKQEFVERLNYLSRLGLIDLILLPHIVLYHQPHAESPDAANKALRKKNTELFRAVVNRPQGWEWRIDRVRRSLANHGQPESDGISVVVVSGDVTAYRAAAEAQGLHAQVITHSTLKAREEYWLGYALSLCGYSRCLIVLGNTDNMPKQWRAGTETRAEWILGDTKDISQKLVGASVSLGSISRASELLQVSDQRTHQAALHAEIWPHRLYRPTAVRDELCVGIITYNRPEMLRTTIKTLMESKSPHIDYRIVVSDDNSAEAARYILEWANDTYGVEILDNPQRGGVAEQSNRILRYFNGLSGLGVIANDDLLFKPGWDEAYLAAYKLTPWSHFVFMDTDLEKRIIANLYPVNDLRLDNGVFLVNWRPSRIQGALITFDQQCIDRVGAFDSERFGWFSHEHVDWTLRNQRAGLAPGGRRLVSGCYDVLGMDRYVSLNMHHYRRSVPDSERDASNETRFRMVESNLNRIYLPLGD